MKPKERILKIQEITGMNGAKLAAHIGVETDALKSIRTEKVLKISQRVADAVVKKFPKFNKLWVMTGEGEIFNESEEVSPKEFNYDARINELLTICSMQEESIKTLTENVNSLTNQVESLLTCVRDLLNERAQNSYAMVAEDKI